MKNTENTDFAALDAEGRRLQLEAAGNLLDRVKAMQAKLTFRDWLVEHNDLLLEAVEKLAREKDKTGPDRSNESKAERALVDLARTLDPKASTMTDQLLEGCCCSYTGETGDWHGRKCPVWAKWATEEIVKLTEKVSDLTLREKGYLSELKDYAATVSSLRSELEELKKQKRTARRRAGKTQAK